MKEVSEATREQTLVVIKPDGVQRSLIGEIVKRIERTGLKLVGLKMIVPSAEFVRAHYTLDAQWLVNVGNKGIAGMRDKGLTPESDDPLVAGNKVLDSLAKYFTSGPVVVMVWQGAHSVAIVRKLVGSTEPLSSDVGTIRGDFVIDSYPLSNGNGRAVRNVVHASGSPDEARAEIGHWFAEGELLKYRLVSEQILYDVNLDGILE
jgi:nucleoside-diphosphate kinase